ncbi:hypothetical protein K8R43_02400 [archaeon]|nr:hypothetical protein [archaeon]
MSSDKEEIKEAVLNSFNRSHKRVVGVHRDSFNRQFYAEGLGEIWAAFDGFLSMNYPAQNNYEMRKQLCDKYQPIFMDWKGSDNYKQSLERLRQLGPVKDMRTVNPRKDLTIDGNNLFSILQFSYRVRSNLKHGAKNLEGNSEKAVRNRELVQHSLFVTYEILYRILRHEGMFSG